MRADDELDLDRIASLRIETQAAIEGDVREREQEIEQQVGRVEGAGAKVRFAQIWAAYQYRCLLDEATAECRAELPEHSCAVLVGMHESGLATMISSQQAAQLANDTCSRGNRNVCFRIAAFYERSALRRAAWLLRAAELYELGCDRGHALSCERLLLLQPPENAQARVSELRARATRLTDALCDHGDPEECFQMAVRMRQHAQGIADAAPRALEMTGRACSRGSSAACNALGMAYEQGLDVSKSTSTAAAFYRRACDLNNGLGCSSLGLLLEVGAGLPQSPRQAVELYARACELSNPNGCNYLCWARYEGRIVTRSLPEAASACAKGCDLSDSNSCTLLAWFHHVGAGVVHNDGEALELGRRACDGGDVAGCSNLAELLTQLPGVRRDERKALALFEAACDQGSESACANLGLMQELGIQMQPDPERAMRLYRKAAPSRAPDGYYFADELWSYCNLRDGRACTLLGTLTRYGLGTTRDLARSRFFLGKACTLGDEWGCVAAGRVSAAGAVGR